MANMRITGMISGFDTDTMIKDLMKAESAKADKVKKDKQYSVWQRDGFREIINKLRTFQSSHFDVLKSGQNISSPTSFAKFSYSVMSGTTESTKISVSANADIKNKEVTVNSITQLATKDNWTGNDADLRGVKSSVIDITALKSALTSSGKDLEFTLAIGNNAQKILLTNAEIDPMDTATQLATKLQAKITAAFGTDYGNIVSAVGSAIEFDVAGSDLTVMKYSSNSESMTALFGSDATQSSTAYKSKTIGEIYGLNNGTLADIVINGKTIVLDSGDTIDKMLLKVNASDANVTMNYDTLKDKFTLTSKTEGSVNNIKIDDGSNTETLLSKLFNVAEVVDSSGSAVTQVEFPASSGLFVDTGLMRLEGKNAILMINDVTVTQSNNTFTLDGMTYSLKETSATAINIKTETNTTGIIDNIKNFVKDYNDIVDFISAKLSEKRDYDYSPLTDEEKEALSEEEVKIYEEKAKAGMLRGSSELNSLLLELRNSVIEPIVGVGITMNQIGISSTSYADRGKLTIDETKLKSSLENNYDEVVNLFTKKSETSYLNSAERATRSSENGIASRFEDVLKDYTRVTRDKDGLKGKLIVKAGIENDASQFSNDFQNKITSYDNRIADLLEYLSDREEYYYTMFSRMESALSQMQSQSDSLMSQLG